MSGASGGEWKGGEETEHRAAPRHSVSSLGSVLSVLASTPSFLVCYVRFLFVPHLHLTYHSRPEGTGRSPERMGSEVGTGGIE